MLRRRKTFHDTPTVDLYFRLPLRGLIAEVAGQTATDRPIRRIGDHCFVAGRRGVIIRYASRRELRRLRAAGITTCAYLIDDDLYAARHDATLPPSYRRRLQRFCRRMLPRILDICDTIVAPNEVILAAYAEHQRHVLHPAPLHICSDFSHFAPAEPLRIVFAGTRSHLHDLQFIAPLIADICRRHPQVSFTTFLGRHAPAALKGLPNVHHLRPQGWQAFRRILTSQRFHIALAPMLDTPFNRARSISKVLDHASFGAAGIYSRNSTPCRIIHNGRHGLCVANDAAQWHAALLELLAASRADVRRMAEEAALHIRQLDLAGAARRFWLSYLRLQ